MDCQRALDVRRFYVRAPSGKLINQDVSEPASPYRARDNGNESKHPTFLKLKGHDMAKKTIAKNRICLWYDKDAEAAARFYAATFPDSSVGAIYHAPSDNPSTKAGDIIMVDFTVAGVPCLGLNGGPAF